MEVYALNCLLALILVILTMGVLHFLFKKQLERISYASVLLLILLSVSGLFTLYFFLCFQLTVRLWLLI